MFPKCRKNKPEVRMKKRNISPGGPAPFLSSSNNTTDIWMGEKCTSMQDPTLQGQRKATKKVPAPHQHSPPSAPTAGEEGGCGRDGGCGAAATTLPVLSTQGAVQTAAEAARAQKSKRAEQSRAKQGSERTGCPDSRAASRASASAMQKSTLRSRGLERVTPRARLNEARQVATGHATLGPHRASMCTGCARRRHVGDSPGGPSLRNRAPPSPEVPQTA